MVEQVIVNAQKPLIIDADGLRAFHGNQNLFKKIKVPFIITPHEGEFCQLMGINRNIYVNSYPDIIEEFMTDFPGVLVLKNAPTITFQNNEAIVNSSGNPGMATAGMGDVLAGVINSFLAQGLNSEHSTILAVSLISESGKISKEKYGIHGSTASKSINNISKIINQNN